LVLKEVFELELLIFIIYCYWLIISIGQNQISANYFYVGVPEIFLSAG